MPSKTFLKNLFIWVKSNSLKIRIKPWFRKLMAGLNPMPSKTFFKHLFIWVKSNQYLTGLCKVWDICLEATYYMYPWKTLLSRFTKILFEKEMKFYNWLHDNTNLLNWLLVINTQLSLDFLLSEKVFFFRLSWSSELRLNAKSKVIFIEKSLYLCPYVSSNPVCHVSPNSIYYLAFHHINSFWCLNNTILQLGCTWKAEKAVKKKVHTHTQ